MTTLNTVAFEPTNKCHLPALLESYQREQRKTLATTALPTRKTESWKYAAKRLGKLTELPRVDTQADTRADHLANHQNHYDLACQTLVIANGEIVSDLPDMSGLSFKPFSALSDAEIKNVTSGIVAEAEDMPISALNSAHFEQGIYISVAKGLELETPLRIVIKHNGHGTSFPRVYVDLAPQSKFTLIEELQVSRESGAVDTTDSTEVSAFCNQVTDVTIGSGAKLTYLRMNVDQGQVKHVGATGFKLMRDARLETHCLALGSELARHDLRVHMLEPGAECDLNGVCCTKDRQLFDNHTSIEHIAANCSSNENYRCIADDHSQIVFNGRIHIHRDAQKTLGAMSNKNLLLSSNAEIDSKPELEIYADDVKCAHGTTIGQLDEEEVYYLKTRGIRDEQARQILTLGFVLEIVRAAPVLAIAEFWEQSLAELLSFEG